MEGSKEKQGDFVFTANDLGEYRFCFNNEMSTFAEKMVDFEIAVSATIALSQASTNATRNRSKTNPAPNSPPSKAHPPNKPPSSKNPS
jgi:hypothetical protein